MQPLRYEIQHGIGTEHFMLYRCQNHVFPMHMHRCYELMLVLAGRMHMQIEKQDYQLTEGDLLLIKPNQLHSYDTPAEEQSECLICVFSDDLIAAITNPLIQYQLPSARVSNLPRFYREMFGMMNEQMDIATVKGFLYTMCGLFYQTLDFQTKDHTTKDTLLLRDIFVYLENHISEPCTLNDLSENLSYHPAYISRYFAKSVGMPYSTYVQAIKIDRACYLLLNTKDSVLSIAISCGFATLSSFNRAFKMVTNTTPRAYRQKMQRNEAK